ncbi:MAG: hypothetical protein ACPG7X_06320 [Flavobacteriaceae bacterium]
MKDLKQLKEKWAQQNFEKQYSKEELNGFLRKKSTYSIKWIFYLSIAEFLVYMGLPLFSPNYIESFAYYKSLQLFGFSIFITITGYILLLYFMWRFFKNYRKITVTSSVKEHLSTILSTRRAVNQYFYANVGLLLIFTLVVFVRAFQMDSSLIGLEQEDISFLVICFVIGIVVALVLGLYGLLYYFVYGRFLKPLKRNEKELRQLNQ